MRKGYCNEYDIKSRPEQALCGDFEPIYVREVPEGAVEIDGFMEFDGSVGLRSVSSRFINKRVKILIWEGTNES
jgi:hypothetical protein